MNRLFAVAQVGWGEVKRGSGAGDSWGLGTAALSADVKVVKVKGKAGAVVGGTYWCTFEDQASVPPVSCLSLTGYPGVSVVLVAAPVVGAAHKHLNSPGEVIVNQRLRTERVFDLQLSLPTNYKAEICKRLSSAETQLELELLRCVMWNRPRKGSSFNGLLASAGRYPLMSGHQNESSALWWLLTLRYFL